MKWQVCWATGVALVTANPVDARPIGYEEALQAASLDQPALEAGELQVTARREAARAADELPDPRLRAGVMNLPVTGPDFFDPTQMTQFQVGLEQEIPHPAERRARAAIASADTGLAEAQLGQVTRDLIVRTGQAWITLAYTQRTLLVAGAALKEVRELVPVANAAVASGSARPSGNVDVRRAVLEIEDALTALEADREAAQAMLTRFVSAEDPVAQGEVPSAEVDPARLRATLARNPEVLLADAASRQARAAVQLAEAEKRPDFGVSASYGVRERDYGDLFSVMGTITLPLFAERRQEPRIRAAEAEAAAALAERDDLLRELEARFEADLARWRSATRQWQRAQEELLPLARERVDLETASFAAGRAELIDVIDAIKALALLEIEVLEREEAAVEAAATLRLTYTENVQ